MRRAALWASLVHGIGIVIGLIWARYPMESAPRPNPIQIQLQSSSADSVRAQTRLSPPAYLVAQPTVPPQRPPPPSMLQRSTDVVQPAPSAVGSSSSAAADIPARLDSPGDQRAVSQEDRQPTVDASARGNRIPDYPIQARRLGEQGVVVLRVLITPDGRASEVQLAQTSGSTRLDRAAIDAVREWRFMPALRGGRPVSAWYEWRWEFRLN